MKKECETKINDAVRDFEKHIAQKAKKEPKIVYFSFRNKLFRSLHEGSKTLTAFWPKMNRILAQTEEIFFEC